MSYLNALKVLQAYENMMNSHETYEIQDAPTKGIRIDNSLMETPAITRRVKLRIKSIRPAESILQGNMETIE